MSDGSFERFISAILEGNFDEVRNICKPDYINQSDGSGMTALHYACEKNNIDIVRYLLGSGSGFECENRDKYRPIHYAAENGYISIVKELINRRCTLNVYTKVGDTPIDLAKKKFGNNSKCTEILREAVAKELLFATESNLIDFMSAIKDGKIDVVKRLYRSDYINKIDLSGMRAMHYACENNNIDIVRYLLDSGSGFECENRDKYRPIHYAAENGYISIVNELINRGCTVNVYTKDGNTPLCLARNWGNNSECTELLQAAANKEQLRPTESNFRDFISATREGNIDHVKIFCHSDYINKRDKSEMTALLYACHSDNIDILRYLLDNGSDIEYEDLDQYRPIHYAAKDGRASIVKELINRGCMVNARNRFGETALDISKIFRNNKGCTEILQAAENVPEIERQMKRAIVSLNNKKEILLGQGAFGRVIRSNNDDVGYNFAVKKITGFAGAFIDKEVKGLENEIKMYTQLEEHDRIVKYYGTHRDNDAIYIFMECMEGGSIEDYLNKHGALTPDKIAHYTKQVLHGLDFLHRKSIIHRDIKGANILQDAQDDIKLCDFSISRYLKIITSQNTMGKANTDCGTSYWMAPEVIRGDDYRFAADIWSLGATVVEMVTGTHPYPRLEPLQAIFRIGTDKKLEYDTPESMTPILQSFIDQMLVPDPMERASIDALLASDFIRDAS